MILMHIIDDFVLQPISLSKLKQKKWWKNECAKSNIDYQKYHFDYFAALLIHGMSWSIMVHLPLIFFYTLLSTSLMSFSIITMALCHAFVDHMKANVMYINLCIDQLIHILQIIIIWFIITL